MRCFPRRSYHSQVRLSPIEDGADLSPEHSPTVGSSEHASLSKQREMFMQLVGGLLWLANMTRPDIAYAACQLSRVLSNPGRVHIRAASGVLIYLRQTSDRKLVFNPNKTRHLETMVDSNWATKFSCSGALYFMYGCLFHWFSKVQRSVTLSSAEAEYFGAMMVARDLVFIRELLVDLSLSNGMPSVISCDSKSAVDMAFDPVAFRKTKHILRAAEFLRDLVSREVVQVKHLSGSCMIADILTKAVARPLFVELLSLLDT